MRIATHNKNRLSSIEFLRGFAALGVLFHHCWVFGDYRKIESGWGEYVTLILTHGHLGVPLFFVISGFCIHLRPARNLIQFKSTKINFREFWKRRFARLYPSYFIIVCAGIILSHLSPSIWATYPEPKYVSLGTDFLLHAFMLHGFHPQYEHSAANMSLWTLTTEECLYLMYFGLLPLFKRLGCISTAFVVFVTGLLFHMLVATVIVPTPSWEHVLYASAIILWIQWCLGAVATERYFRLISLPRWTRSIWLVPILFFVSKNIPNTLSWLSPLAWGLTFFVLLNYCVDLEWKGKWPSNYFIRILEKAGIASYSIYIVHAPVIAIINHLLVRLNLYPTTNAVQYSLDALLVTCVALTSGIIFYVFVEAPLVKFFAVKD